MFNIFVLSKFQLNKTDIHLSNCYQESKNNLIMTIDEYKRIRNVTTDLAYKILYSKKDTRDEMIYAGKLLDFWDGQIMVFDNEDESDVLMDFLIYEKTTKGIKLIDSFYDSDIHIDDLEEEILEGMINYHSSLFEIRTIDRITCTLKLSDLFDRSHKEYKLIDLGFSQTGQVGLVFYSRLIPIRGINMTSGVTFVFNGSLKNRILRDFSFQRFKRKVNANSSDLFVFALKKSKQYGLSTKKMDTN